MTEAMERALLELDRLTSGPPGSLQSSGISPGWPSGGAHAGPTRGCRSRRWTQTGALDDDVCGLGARARRGHETAARV